MKSLMITVFLVSIIMSCTKKDSIEKAASSSYMIRVAAVDNNGTKTYTTISKVKSGKVAVEFETAEVSNIKEYAIEVSSDGSNFQLVKIIPADLNKPNKVYSDILSLN